MNAPSIDLSKIPEPALFGLVFRHDATTAQREAAYAARLLFWDLDSPGLIPTPTGKSALETLRDKWAPSMLTHAIAAQGAPGDGATSPGVARAGIALHQRDEGFALSPTEPE